jgi:PQQ-like domain
MRLPTFAALAAATLMSAPVARAAENDATVPTYHADAARSGHYVFPGLTWANAADMRLDAAFDGRVQGNIYAQPLYWRPPGAAGGLVIVATEDNVVAALDAITGRTVWQRSLGAAETGATGQSCGNILPLGITGTPVIDEHSGALYLDAVVDRGSGLRHLVFGLSLADGAVLPSWPVDMADALGALGMGFDPSVQNQRGALAIVGDGLYVPYSGFAGGCGGHYYGWVVGLRLDQPAVFGAWRTSGRMGGIWAPGGIAYDGRYLFATTGGQFGATDWGGSEAVIRLPPDLSWQPTSQNFFTPADWSTTLALGVANPLPLDLPNVGSGTRALLLALGIGEAYLLDRVELGGVGHPLVEQKIARGYVFSPAAYRFGPDMIAAFRVDGPICPGDTHRDGLMALRISGGPPAAMRTEWCAGVDGRGAPIVTTSDDTADPIVWIVGAEGDGKLHGFRGDTGQEVVTSDPFELFHLRHFVTILAAGGRLYVAGDGRIFAFSLAR